MHDDHDLADSLMAQLAVLVGGGSARPSSGPAPSRSPLRATTSNGRPPSADREPAAEPSPEPSAESAAFFPMAPRSLAEAGISEGEVEAILLRTFLHQGTATGVEISQQIALPFCVIEKLLHSLKSQRLLVIKTPATLNDYLYEMTDAGLQRARRLAEQCAYCGAAPVSLTDYAASVAAQSLEKTRPTVEDLRRAFADLTLSDEMFARLSRAIASGRGLFLHGPPGNGKTSIAERITAVYGTSIWIPRAISAWGEIIRLFDPACHEELPLAVDETITHADKADRRWARIRRPTIVVGGELTMDSLEITVHKDTGTSEAPIQMKSNCGTLVIDDFGRQRISPATLLNRWIVPLEKRHDYLGLASGRKIQVPFDQFTVFSTNLEPRDLVDEAFLRRIPYKIDVDNPTEDQFRQLFRNGCQALGIAYRASALDHLITKHYRQTGRPMRFCHPRDLLHQVAVYYSSQGKPPETSIEAIDAAARDYFSVMELDH